MRLVTWQGGVDAFRALHAYGEREAGWRFRGDPGGGDSTTCSSTA